MAVRVFWKAERKRQYKEEKSNKDFRTQFTVASPPYYLSNTNILTASLAPETNSDAHFATWLGKNWCNAPHPTHWLQHCTAVSSCSCRGLQSPSHNLCLGTMHISNRYKSFHNPIKCHQMHINSRFSIKILCKGRQKSSRTNRQECLSARSWRCSRQWPGGRCCCCQSTRGASLGNCGHCSEEHQ